MEGGGKEVKGVRGRMAVEWRGGRGRREEREGGGVQYELG